MTRCSKLLALAGMCAASSAAFAQPANDNCANATPITPGDWQFNLSEATLDGPPSSGAIFGDETQDVWFSCIASADGILSGTTCGASFTCVTIYTECGGTELGSGMIGSADSPCPFSFAGDARAPVFAGQHVIFKVSYVNLLGGGGPTGTLHVTLGALPASCVIVPPDAAKEDEPCGAATNNECFNATEISATPIDIYGTLVENAPLTDQDWYLVHMNTAGVLRATIVSDVPTVLLSIHAQTGDCAGNNQIAGTYIGERCATGEVTATVAAGDYYIKIMTDTSVGYPCGLLNNYKLHVDTTPLGATCLPSGCAIMTQAQAAAAGGVYQGDGVACATYAAAASSSAYEDIGATGSAGPVGEDTHSTVDVGFGFNFYGKSYSQVSINVNGFLQFGENPNDSAAVFNTPLPRNYGGAPLNAVCGLWDYLITLDESNESNAEHNGQGRIVYQTVGTAPNRRFIAQWIDVGQINFFPLAPEGIPVNFEIVLFEGSNQIEFRYGNLTPDVNSNDYTIGVQDALGINGLNIDSSSIGQGNTALVLAPSASTCATVCPADLGVQGGLPGRDGQLDNNDFIAFINYFFEADSHADFGVQGGLPGHDGQFDNNDFIAFINAFFAGCGG